MSAIGPDVVTFRAVLASDLPMLGEWMARPHWQEWWGPPETELGYVRAMIEGRDTSCRPMLFSVGGDPAGYIQVWQVGPHQTPQWSHEHPWLMEVPSDAVGVDLSLADGGKLSRGIGSRVLRRFASMLLAEGHRSILIDPDPANARAVAAYRKAGFRPVPHLEGRTPGVLIMQFQQDSDLI